MADSSLPNMLFFGGLGLFTVNGIPKASYYAYTLLQQLGDQFLGRGDEYFITREMIVFKSCFTITGILITYMRMENVLI